jgi:hypothetical protein
MSEELAHEEIQQAVDRAVEELLGESGIHEPPVDAVALARHLGLELPAERPSQRATNAKRIALRPDHSEEQRQLAAALAIAAHLKADLLSRLGIDPDGGRPLLGGSLAGMFADQLLVPTTWLADEARSCGHDLLALKERFRTAGHERIAWRLLDLDEPCIITVLDNDHVSRRRSNRWRVNRDLSAPERACQQQVHRYSRPCRVRQDGWDVQGWPVHQPDWKREVLRSVITE